MCRIRSGISLAVSRTVGVQGAGVKGLGVATQIECFWRFHTPRYDNIKILVKAIINQKPFKNVDVLMKFWYYYKKLFTFKHIRMLSFMYLSRGFNFYATMSATIKCVVIFLLIAKSLCIPRRSGPGVCAGCPIEASPHDPMVRRAAMHVISFLNGITPGHFLLRILRAQTQVRLKSVIITWSDVFL